MWITVGRDYVPLVGSEQQIEIQFQIRKLNFKHPNHIFILKQLNPQVSDMTSHHSEAHQ